MPLASPPFLQVLGCDLDALSGEVVQHNDVRTSPDGLVRLRLALHLDFHLQAEAADGLGGGDGVGDAPAAPHVVVLQHDHGRQVHPVAVRPTDQHAVLLDQAEPRGRLARARQLALVPRRAQVDEEPAGHGGDAAAPGEDVEGDALAEQDAARGAGHGRDLGLEAAGRGPLDVAALGGVPLDGAAALREDLVEEGHAGQDACGLGPEGGGARDVADDEAAVVEGGGVFGQPGGDLGLPRGGQEVLQGAVVQGHWKHSFFFLGLLCFPSVSGMLVAAEDDPKDGGVGLVIRVDPVCSVPEAG